MHFPGLNLRLIQIMQRIYTLACIAFFLLCLFYLCIHLNCNFSATQHSQPQRKMVPFHLTHEHPCPYYFLFNDISFHFKLKFHLICPKRNDVDCGKSQHVGNVHTHSHICFTLLCCLQLCPAQVNVWIIDLFHWIFTVQSLPVSNYSNAIYSMQSTVFEPAYWHGQVGHSHISILCKRPGKSAF